jgi:hypothetical protein
MAEDGISLDDGVVIGDAPASEIAPSASDPILLAPCAKCAERHSDGKLLRSSVIILAIVIALACTYLVIERKRRQGHSHEHGDTTPE